MVLSLFGVSLSIWASILAFRVFHISEISIPLLYQLGSTQETETMP